jgi:hypothetical protein
MSSLASPEDAGQPVGPPSSRRQGWLTGRTRTQRAISLAQLITAVAGAIGGVAAAFDALSRLIL